MTQQHLTTSDNQPLAPTNPLAMVQTALDKGMDAETIRQFMDLAREHQADQARHAYTEAMSRFRAQCPTISKTRNAHNSKYAGLAETIEQIKGILSECGLSHSWRTEQADGMISVTCVVTHVDGHREQTTLSSAPDDGGKMNSIQRIASAVSYLQRYTLFAILGLASADMDDDGYLAGSAKINDSDLANIIALMDELGERLNREGFATYLQSIGAKDGQPESIPASKVSTVFAMLERKRKS